MPEKLTRESYLKLVQKSGLVEKPRLQAFLDELRQRRVRPKQPDELADELVAAGLLTRWQARTLLKGRYKGFHLGKYKLLDLLGTGGMGSVYLAEHVLMRRKVAIKVLPLKRVGRKAYIERFYREARAVAQLDHPNIVRAYDVDQDGDVHFLVMEFVDGTSLFKLIKQHGPLPPRRAAACVRQASEGLRHAFEAGLVHRDIKPGNLLVDRRDTVKLADLGLARFFREEDEEPLTSYQKEAVLGTVDYLAPEQALDSHTVDIRADIYSLGCTLYFLLTGRPPFDEGTMAQRLMFHQTREPTPLHSLRPEVPASLVAIVEKMMAKDPARRYQTPTELNEELDAWFADIAGPPIDAHSPAPAEPRHDVPVLAAVKPPSQGDAAFVEQDAAPRRAPSSPAVVRRDEPTDEPDDDLDRFLANLESDSAPPEQAASSDTSSNVLVEPPDAEPLVEEPPSGVPDNFAPTHRSPAESGHAGEALSTREPEATAHQKPESELDPESPEPAALDELVFEPIDEAPEAEVPADSEPQEPVAEAPRHDSRNKYFVAAAVVILAATVFVVLYPLIFSGRENGASRSGTGTANDARNTRAPTGGLTPRKPRPGPKRPLVWVKPFGGDFRSIDKALQAAEAGQIIRVAGGETYQARIELDGGAFPEDVQLEVESGARATLQVIDKTGPLVQLRGVKGFRMRGFDLDAGGHEVAVRLEGKLAGTRLSDMTIRGFRRAGIELRDCTGEIGGRVGLARIAFQADAKKGDAAGVVLSSAASDPDAIRHLVIDQCRFDSSMAQGVRFETAADNVEISRCVLVVTDVGILLQATSDPWRAIALTNNTFSGSQRGIVFRDMPPEGSRDLAMRNNLFYNLTGPAGEVEQGYDDPRMVGAVLASNPPGASHNWDNRPPKETEKPQGALPLFGIQGRREPFAKQFVSTDPSHPDFLRPRPATPLATQGAGGELPSYIGALDPDE